MIKFNPRGFFVPKNRPPRIQMCGSAVRLPDIATASAQLISALLGTTA